MPRKKHQPSYPVTDDPLEYLKAVMNDPDAAPTSRLRAAIAAAQYTHAKKGEGGKKEDAQEKAARVAEAGKFAPASGPRLVVNNR